MKANVKIGEEIFPLRSSGLTSVIYKNLFGEDLIAMIYSSQGKDDSLIKSIDFISKLAFIMNWQSINVKDTVQKSKALTLDDYYEWLDGLDQQDLLDADFTNQVIGLWIKSAKAELKPKNA